MDKTFIRNDNEKRNNNDKHVRRTRGVILVYSLRTSQNILC